ncbi:group-specific protein [Peribacillus saganii]|uniref:Group-specific protein n=1 Tax=Peribacillus saganii TaxID=2303992 RepID=A0A372LTT5_9BACI|nr:group-specific protein [Peribacillus saganii]RFU70964.1 group-specific protein [Peribacillus saganii]
MGLCNIDHTTEDVKKKYESQKSFLPDAYYSYFDQFLQEDKPQEALNELFHLLKKYDLVTEEERISRNKEIVKLLDIK